ncbi:glycosyltransferase family 2 protein [Natronobiforma cellulositropha]|uniref:glycosyltransferase n=1 Tax=Natronobiforma cellulositropha TaxID=1679076 RepID=UPI0021D5B4F0|nr:glycosyltransferase [Natronobiforma cellulositropha]
MSETSGDVGIVIRARNEAEMIGETLSMIDRQRHPPAEVVVVDCHSTDGTRDIAAEYGATVVDMHPDEFTYGYGINVGIEHTESDLCCILSAHAVPTTTAWLENLVAALDDPETAAAYGRQVVSEQGDPLERRSLEAVFGTDERLQRRDPFFSNANSLVRRECWERVPFDEEVSYSEDRLWAREMQQRGYAIRYVPTAPVFHEHRESLRDAYRRNVNQGRAERDIDGTRPSPLAIPRNVVREVGLDYLHFGRNPREWSIVDLVRAPFVRTAEQVGFYDGTRR